MAKMKQNAWILFHGEAMKIRTLGVYDADGRRKYLTNGEGEKFRQVAANLPRAEAVFCLTIYYTGCRISEALALVPGNLDSEAKALLVHSLKKRSKTLIRRIQLPESLLCDLQELAALKPEGKLWDFSRTTGWRIIKQAMDEAGITGIHATAKGLRHGFGMRCALARVPVSMIQMWMGHSHPATTAIYLEAKDDEARSLIERTWI